METQKHGTQEWESLTRTQQRAMETTYTVHIGEIGEIDTPESTAEQNPSNKTEEAKPNIMHTGQRLAK